MIPNDFLLGLVISAIAFVWIFGIWKSIGYAASRRQKKSKTPKRQRFGHSLLTTRAILFYSRSICLFAGISLGVIFNNRPMFAPLVLWGSLGIVVLYFYCHINNRQVGDERDLEARKRLSTSIDLPAGNVLLISRANWVANKPGLFATGVLWVVCSILLCLVLDRYSDLILCIPGITFLLILWMFSRLNCVVIKKSGTSVGYGFPVEAVIDFSYGANLNVSVTQNWMQRLLSVYAVSIAEKGRDPITIPLSDGQEVGQLIQDSCH